MTHPVNDVLDELAALIGAVGTDQAPLPTPCSGYDVGELRGHILGWLPVFATALTEPTSDVRPDPSAYRAPDDAASAVAEVRASATAIEKAIAGGVADQPVTFLGGELPGRAILDMLTGELIAHGWDLARATGRPWDPPAAACETARTGMGAMLAPEYRGAGKPFGEEVPVADDASPLDKLIAFTGRDPAWSAPSPA